MQCCSVLLRESQGLEQHWCIVLLFPLSVHSSGPCVIVTVNIVLWFHIEEMNRRSKLGSESVHCRNWWIFKYTSHFGIFHHMTPEHAQTQWCEIHKRLFLEYLHFKLCYYVPAVNTAVKNVWNWAKTLLKNLFPDWGDTNCAVEQFAAMSV